MSLNQKYRLKIIYEFISKYNFTNNFIFQWPKWPPDLSSTKLTLDFGFFFITTKYPRSFSYNSEVVHANYCFLI